MCFDLIIEPSRAFSVLKPQKTGILKANTSMEGAYKMKKVWICGDSILRGVVWSEEQKRYTNSCAIGYDAIESRFGISLSNCSRFGYTLSKGAEYLFSRLDRGETCDIAILEYGGNDSDFNWAEISSSPKEEHFSHTAPKDFEAYYRRMISALRGRGILPVLCNLVPVCSGRYLDWVSQKGLSKENILQWLGEEDVIFRYQEQFSKLVEHIASDEGCPLVDLRTSFLNEDMESYFCIDGIHPSIEGQRLLGKSLMQLPTGLFEENRALFA